jgi:guanine deaminase
MLTGFMSQAIELAVENVRQGNGGPFAALVVKRGSIIATGVNRVTATNDPTAHAEVVVIREACRALGSHQLTGCDLYTTCEPCPMCLGAVYWARPARVFFAATQDEAAAAGFDDSFIYRQFAVPREQRSIPLIHVADGDAGRPFREWADKAGKQPY